MCLHHSAIHTGNIYIYTYYLPPIGVAAVEDIPRNSKYKPNDLAINSAEKSSAKTEGHKAMYPP